MPFSLTACLVGTTNLEDTSAILIKDAGKLNFALPLKEQSCYCVCA